MTELTRLVVKAGALAAVLFAGTVDAGHAESLDWQPVSVKDRAALTYAIPIGAEDHFPIYACRGQAGAGVQPGRFRSDFAGCHIGYAGQEISVMPFEVLTSAWQDETDGNIPPNSLAAGQRVQFNPPSHFNLVALYPCRTTYQGSIQVGEVALGDRGCNFGFGGRQVTELKYQVLWRAPWMTWTTGIAHQLPAGAVVAGAEGGETFYICRAADRMGLHPGKVKQSSPGCSVASDGKELVSIQFALLVPEWLAGNAGSLPIGALPAGQEKQEPLYLCRTQIKNTVQIGKVTEQLASCHVGMAGGEVASQSYDVLSER